MFFTNTLRAIVLLLALCLSSVAEAACRTTLHYVNGVMNDTHTEADFITETIQKELKSEPSICVGEPLYNSSQKLLMDLAETYKLKMDEGGGFWSKMWNGFFAGWLAAWHNIIAISTGNATDIYNYKAEMEAMYTKLKPELVAGNGHVLVAHSEGNLLAMQLQKIAVADGYSAGRIAIMHVAAPAKIVLSLQRTMTVLSSEDRVIGAYTLTSVANKPNFVPDLATQPELGHSMLAVYLNPENVGTFTNFNCEKNRIAMVSEIVGSIRRAAQCQFGPCINLSFSNGEC